MHPGIFVRLRRYRSTPDRDPREDFVTEALVATLEADSGLGVALARDLASRAGWNEPIADDARVAITTQVRVETGIVDMLFDIEGGPMLICENKAWAPLQPDQPEKYRRALKPKYGSRLRTVIISANPAQWTQDADARLTWSDVYDNITRWQQVNGQATLGPDLLELLRAEGLHSVVGIDAPFVPAELDGHVQRIACLRAFLLSCADALRLPRSESRKLNLSGADGRPFEHGEWRWHGLSVPLQGPTRRIGIYRYLETPEAAQAARQGAWLEVYLDDDVQPHVFVPFSPPDLTPASLDAVRAQLVTAYANKQLSATGSNGRGDHGAEDQ